MCENEQKSRTFFFKEAYNLYAFWARYFLGILILNISTTKLQKKKSKTESSLF